MGKSSFFDAAPFLDNLVRSAFENPEVLRLPPHQWPSSKPARVHCSRQELLKLVDRWDSLGACCVIDRTTKDFDEAVGLFCVPKDDSFDRLIINPKTINSRMFSISSATRDLAPGSMLSLLTLEPGFVYRFNAHDLTDFYYTFCVSLDRASRNALRMEFSWDELKHLKCVDESFKGKTLLVCLKTLAMGDSLAVEIAQQSHCRVLQKLCGAMISSETLRYRFPVPRSDFIELLAIDDHVGIQKVTHKELREGALKRDSQVFEASEVAYKRVGLIQHPKKRKRGLTQGIILGADFDGLKGKVMAPRNRVLILCVISSALARVGTCTRKVLSVLLGCWIHVLLFRRVLFAVIDDLFRQGADLPPDQIFCLSRKSRSELQLLSVLGPLAQSDLTATYSSTLFCTDASPQAGAVISAPIGASATKELWRHCEQRGYYTRLQSPLSEIMHEKGLDPISTAHYEPRSEEPLKSAFSIPPPIPEGVLFDCIEIFRGTGNWSEAHLAQGLVVHDGVDVGGSRLRYADMSDPATFHELVGLSLRRVVREWHFGLPCISFGTLRRPQVRSKEFPGGFDAGDSFTKYHNTLARRSAFLITICVLQGQYISVEQPGSSRLYLLHCYQVLVMLGCVISHYCFCGFGSPLQKASKWLHNKPWLVELECKCECEFKGRHFVVQGSFTEQSKKDFVSRCRPSCTSVYGREPDIGETVANFSAQYPFGLVTQMASGSAKAKLGEIPAMPASVRERSLQELDIAPVYSSLAPNAEEPYPPREWHEDPEWVSEIADSIPFREVFRYRFSKPGHINVNEARAYKSWIKSLAKTEGDCRVVALLDSRVTIGASAKGRSSSFAISRVLQTAMPYVLGAGIYPGLLHVGSSRNRADGPSRSRGIEPPTKQIPLWFDRLQQGQPQKFDAVVESCRIQKNPARWLRFLLMLAGDIEPNPGPRAGLPAPRGPMDMTVGFAASTSDRMAKCFAGFRAWVEEHAAISWTSLEGDLPGMVCALRGYGLFCFEAGYPRYLLVYAITAVQEYYPGARSIMGPAWQVDKKWQIHEPGQCRAVLPPVIVKAAVCLAALWKWPCWVAGVLLAFSAMLHPSELLALVRRDLVFPSDVNFDSDSLFVRIRDPKTSRFARRQHGKIDDPDIIQIIESVFGALPLNCRLMPGAISAFRRQWNCIMEKLGVPFRQTEKGATPGVLRGSGATYLYSCCEDVNWIAWRGRWARVKTLEYYLQEVAAQMLIHELSEKSKRKIFTLADYSFQVLRCSIFAEQDVRSGKKQKDQNNQMDYDFKFGQFGEKFGEKLFTASATRAAGISSSNLGAFDHAGENRDAYYPFVRNLHDHCCKSFGSQNPPLPYSKEAEGSEQSDGL